MKITVTIDGKRLPCSLPYSTAPYADVGGDWRCACGSNRVSGKDISHDHDTYRSTGYCADCKAKLGALEARVDTLFGIEEDEAVLHGRPRVY